MPAYKKPNILTYHLYNRERSSCCRRIRIALALKNIPNVVLHNVDTDTGEHMTEEYRAMNPSGAVPTFVREITSPTGEVKERFVLTQSTAILEYLVEKFPLMGYPLMPDYRYMEQKARIREMMAIVSQDIFPIANRKNANRIREIRDSENDQISFLKVALHEGFDAYEKMLEKYGGCYSVGDELSMADVCLAPMVLQAKMWGVDVCTEGKRWPKIKIVVEECGKIKAFAHEMGLAGAV
jgi:maleylacetoacetate isomerase